jgi:transposase
MSYVGIDLHRQFFVYYATDKEGNEITKGKKQNTVVSVEELVGEFPSAPSVVIEATRNWEWIVTLLKLKGCTVTLAHPFKTKAIASARIKTDAIDAKTLCHLLRTDLIPRAYIATGEHLDNRELSRGRINLVHDQTLLKNRIMAILAKENLNYRGSDLFGVRGKAWLTTQSLSASKREMVDVYMKRLTDTQGAIKTVDALIKEKSSSDPRVKILNTIPGIGSTTAFLLASEIGAIERFTTSKQFTSYFGLVPRLSQSGGHAYYGRITKLGNPYVRWSLVQASHRLARVDKQSKQFIQRLTYKHGKKKAIVALARKLAVIVFCVLKENRPYKEQKPGRSGPAIIPEKS